MIGRPAKKLWRLRAVARAVTFLLPATLLLALAMPAGAHDMWILPSTFDLEEGELVSIALRVGHADAVEVVRRQPERIVRFEAFAPVDATKAPSASEVPGMAGKDPAGVLRPATAGLWTLVYESKNSYSELDAAGFAAYLEEEGLDSVVEWRRRHGEENQPGRELYRRSLKSLLTVGTAGMGNSFADRAVGLPLEFVLEQRPTTEQRRVTLQVLWQGAPLARALVDLQPLAGEGESLHARTDDTGRVQLAITAGRWLAAVIHSERAAPAAAKEADWQSVFSTLTFSIDEF